MNLKKTACKINFAQATVSLPLSTENEKPKTNPGLRLHFFIGSKIQLTDFTRKYCAVALQTIYRILKTKTAFRLPNPRLNNSSVCKTLSAPKRLPPFQLTLISPPAPLLLKKIIAPKSIIKTLVPDFLLPELKITG